MFEQYFDAKFKPLSEIFFLKIIFGKKQTQNFPQLDNSHISTIVKTETADLSTNNPRGLKSTIVSRA